VIDFDRMITESIDSLATGNPKEAAESLVEIARLMHSVGYPQRGFISVRAHIIAEATRRTDQYFIEDRLKIAERELQKARFFTH